MEEIELWAEIVPNAVFVYRWKNFEKLFHSYVDIVGYLINNRVEQRDINVRIGLNMEIRGLNEQQTGTLQSLNSIQHKE